MDHKDDETTFPGDVTTTFGGGTAISAGATANTVGGTTFRPVPAEFNHCIQDVRPDGRHAMQLSVLSTVSRLRLSR